MTIRTASLIAPAAATLAASLLSTSAFSQTWTSSHPDQPSWPIRYAASVAEQGGQNQIFLFGGTESLTSQPLVWRYHRTNGWFVMGNMPGGRHDMAAATVELGGQDYVYLLGGGAGATSAMNTNWRYDVAADTWDTATFAPMPVEKTSMEAVAAPNGNIYVFGGHDADGGTTYDSMHIYNPLTNTWSAGPTMPRARRNFAALKDCDGFIYLYGGNAGSTIHAEIDCFDTTSGTWLATNPHGGAFPNMPTPRTNVAGALGRNGRHYITGGNTLGPVPVPTVESFDPYNNVWSSEAGLLESRNAHRAVGLGSRIWVPGGFRKIWTTTRKLESFGALGNYGPCGDDVAPLPPPVIGATPADAAPLDFLSTWTGGTIDPDSDHWFTLAADPNIVTFVDVNVSGDDDLGATVYDDQLNEISQNSASKGILLDPSGIQTQAFYIKITRGHGIGSSGYDLYCSSTNDPQPIGQVYCHGATPNSSGDPSGIRALGLASAEANSIQLQVASLPQQTFGYFLVSPEAGTIANPGGSQGTLCLSGFQIGRYAGDILNAGDSGRVALDIDVTTIPGTPASAGAPGDVWYFTYWHRDSDSAGGATSNFSDGICIELR